MKYVIKGRTPLTGTLFVQGAKNAVLPMIAASLLPEKGQTILRNVPSLNDVKVSLSLAESLGAKVDYFEKEEVLVIDSSSMNRHVLDDNITTKSRASVLFLAPILNKFKKVEYKGFGGCAIGPRRLDFHHNGFKRLGATVEQTHDDSLIVSANSLKGNMVYLDMPSQTSTENLMMGAALAEGTTIIENAGSEPEVVDFGNFLIQMGAKIDGLGTRTMIIEGIQKLQATDYTVMDDRLDAGPFMMAAAITEGDISFVGAQLDQMRLLVIKLQQMGVDIESNGKIVRVRGPKRLNPINAITWPYPGLATDFLPGLTALASVANGTSYLRENVFEDRFTQAEGLRILGAKIDRKEQNFAIIEGIPMLKGATVHAPDLRAGMAYVIASLVAEGETVIENIYQIERGHSYVDKRLQSLGATITRIES